MEAVPLVLEAPGTCYMQARSQKWVSTLSLRTAPYTPHFLVIVSPGWTHIHSFTRSLNFPFAPTMCSVLGVGVRVEPNKVPAFVELTSIPEEERSNKSIK